FSVVPFSASVNVGANNRTANWMDQNGVSPIHHENLNWGTMGAASTPWKLNGANGAKLDASGKALTRFTILDNLKFASGGTESTLPIAPVAPALGSCRVWKSGTGTSSGSATDANCAVKDRVGTITMLRPSVTADRATLATLMGTTDAALKEKYVWKGCVEARPYPYNLQDDSPSGSTPATYFVPMMALDEFNNVRYGITSNSSTTSGDSGSGNNWWPESVTATSRLISDSTANYTSAGTPSTAWKVSTGRDRFADATKYYNETPYLLGSSSTVSAANVTSTSSSVVRKGQWHYFKADPGVNVGCTTTPITPLTGTESTVISAINALQPTGNTNVTEGLAWGWRTVSAEEPFSEGVANTNRGVDKVIIVFTDGANTYSAMSANADYAAQVSTYAAYGYTGWANNTASTNTGTQIGASNKARIFQGTTLGQTTANYSTAMITQMGELCTNIKAGDRILLMTVALDLDKTVSSENQMITALKNCAGTSKTRKTSSGDPEKMFWNACTRTVSDGSCTPLDDTFKQIKDELSNLRFVG
ncbi:MAG: vWA domain-containing protein, partial [Rhizobiaceae bacterium]